MYVVYTSTKEELETISRGWCTFSAVFYYSAVNCSYYTLIFQWSQLSLLYMSFSNFLAQK